MPVSLAEVGRHARMNVTFAGRRGRTVIADAYCEVPFKITRLHGLHNGRFPDIEHLILVHCTAGVFGGDNLECTIDVGTGARVLITPQSATKVHPSGGRLARLNTRIRVCAGGELHLYSDPLIPFAGSRLNQTTFIEVHPDARLYLWESFMAGRIGYGESWKFSELAVETRLESSGQLFYLDRFKLTPALQTPAAPWALGRSSYTATGLCFGQNAERFANRYHETVPEAGVDLPASGLAAIRVVAAAGPELHRCRAAFAAMALTIPS